jgi:heme exporter protein CcmD
MSEWLAMGGHGYFIWMSYAMTALAVAVELWSIRRRRRLAWKGAIDSRDEMQASGQHRTSPP